MRACEWTCNVVHSWSVAAIGGRFTEEYQQNPKAYATGLEAALLSEPDRWRGVPGKVVRMQ